MSSDRSDKINEWPSVRDILSEKKIIKNSLLNYAGVQAARYLLASAFYAARGVTRTWSDGPELAALRKDGFVCIPNFLSGEVFKEIQREFEEAMKLGDYRPAIDGENRWERYKLSATLWPKFKAISELVSDLRLKSILEGAERRSVSINDIWMEIIKHGNPSEDPQKELHTDIFFKTHKVWFFLEPVNFEDGPLCYVKGTHRTSLQRAAFEYKKSIRFRNSTEYSFRVGKDDGFPTKEEMLVLPANTLLIANTHGIHRRGDGLLGQTRKQIHFSIRENPFSFS